MVNTQPVTDVYISRLFSANGATAVVVQQQFKVECSEIELKTDLPIKHFKFTVQNLSSDHYCTFFCEL